MGPRSRATSTVRMYFTGISFVGEDSPVPRPDPRFTRDPSNACPWPPPWHWGKLRARRGASGPAARGVRGCTLRVAGPLATKYGEVNCPSARLGADGLAMVEQSKH